MGRRSILVALMGGLVLIVIGAALAARHAGFNGTAVMITVGMLCGPGVAAVALVAACSLVGPQSIEMHEG